MPIFFILQNTICKRWRFLDETRMFLEFWDNLWLFHDYSLSYSYPIPCWNGISGGCLVRERGLEEVNANRNINARP